MKVVSDTSPISYLVLIDYTNVLPQLFGSVVIPQAVHDELIHAGIPMQLREWMAEMPAWLQVERLVARSDVLRPFRHCDLKLDRQFRRLSPSPGPVANVSGRPSTW